jgi:hypothetical protein
MLLRESIEIPIYVGKFDIVITESGDEYQKYYSDQKADFDANIVGTRLNDDLEIWWLSLAHRFSTYF